MNFWDGQQWSPSQPSFDVAADGFVATRLQYLVNINSQINGSNAINVLTRDGVTIRFTPVALALYDRASGASLIIAAITNSTGVLASSNKVVFENAFHGVSADLVYTIEKGSFDQDAVIRTRLDPADYGFSRETSRIQVLTEIYEAPVPDRIRRPLYVEERDAVRKQMVTPDVIDDLLGFGEFVLATGRAFSSEFEGNPTNSVASVAKELKTIEQRRFIVESVEYSQVKEHLDALPAPEQREAALKKRIAPAKTQVGYAAIPLPAAKVKKEANLKRDGSIKKTAFARRKGVTIDFTATIGSTITSATVFQGDTTYFVSGPIACNATITVEGGAVFKFKHTTTSPTGDAYLLINNGITCKTTSYRPAIFTAVDDDSVGVSLNGYSGSGYQTPNAIRTDGYANPALWLNNVNQEMANLRFCYCAQAIRLVGSTITTTVSHSQFVNCILGISISGCGCGSGLPIINNSLFAKVTTSLLIGRPSYPKFVHCTFDLPPMATLVATSGPAPSAICYFYNSIFANVYHYSAGSLTMSGDYNGFIGSGTFGTHAVIESGSSPFEARGAGNYYLAPFTTFRNAGTTSGISNSLLAALGTKTADPPIMLSGNTYAGGLIMGPEVQPDTNSSPHLGFHYDKLDFLISELNLTSSGAAAILTNGVAVGIYGDYGFSLLEQNSLISEGKPLALNRLVFYPSVQEQTNFIGSGVYSTATGAVVKVSGAIDTTANITKPIIQLRFTDVPMLGLNQSFFFGDANPRNLNALSLKDSCLRGVSLAIAATNSAFPQNSVPLVTLWNNLFERTAINLYSGLFNGSGTPDNPLSLAANNNLFFGASLILTNNSNASGVNPSWTFRDNLFDSETFTVVGNHTNAISRSNDAFFNTSGTNYLTDASTGTTTDKALSALAYATGPEGSPWYFSSSTPTIYQVDSTRSSAAAGLYHYAFKTDQVKAAANNGSIGWHHVALVAGQPADFDNDKLPDYWEDANGDGSVSGDLFFWTSSDSDGDTTSDWLEFVEGRNPTVPTLFTDPAFVILEVYTPNR